MKVASVAVILAIFGCFYVCSGAIFRPCGGEGKQIENLDSLVSVSNCTKAPCKLKKNTIVEVKLKFTPDKAIKEITNRVYAIIINIPFPFLGTDGTNAAGNVFELDGKKKATFPLEAGKQYLYKNQIEVLALYPNVKVVVHWALATPDGEAFCFRVPARIIN